MKFTFFHQLSLKVRVTVFTLIIFVTGIWSIVFYAQQMLQTDMRHLLGEQQLSTVSLLATEINNELNDRFNALDIVAAQTLLIDIKNDSAALRDILERNNLLQQLFNGGVYVMGLEGVAVASFPVSSEKISANDEDDTIQAWKIGKKIISRPFIDKHLNTPVFVMTVPIRDKQNKIIGRVSGVINLGVPNFLDDLTKSRYSKTGYYLLVAPKYRMVVTASEKNRVMENLPAKGINPFIDSFIDGYEGPAETVTPRGVEMLASAKPVHIANWYVCVLLPIAEAYAPIQAMQYRIFSATFFLMCLIGSAMWWMLKHELTPLIITLKNLASWQDTLNDVQFLPTFGREEIDELIDGFNNLLKVLLERKAQLQLLVEKERENSIEKSNFLAMLAHELKSPLATIELAVKNIQRSQNPEIKELSLNHIQSAAHDMSVITERCLQVDKLEQANSTISVITFPLEVLIHDRRLHGQWLDPNEDSRLQLDIPPQLFITSDELLCRIILSNLVENALKYSPLQSQVLISAKVNAEPAGVLISVCNEIGRAGKPDAGKVFNKYYRSENAQRLRGTGLGLWLVRGIATQLGGTVNYIEHNDKVEFQLWLPQ